jgi:integrase
MEAPIRREKPRDRDLSLDEISVFWHALDNAPLSDGLKLALKLALTTAQRIGEVSGIAVGGT